MISGTFFESGTFNISIKLSDSTGATVEKPYTLTVVAAAAPTLDTITLPEGVVGTSYSTTLSASGGVQPRTFSVAGTLPAGLTLNSTTGKISGISTAAGLTNLTFTVTDSAIPTARATSVILPLRIWSTVPVNGVCGSSNGEPQTIAPVTNLCLAGTATTVSGTGPWSWTCAGINSGTTATCSSPLQTYTITFAAGSGGSLSSTASQTVSKGAATAAITAQPATGYHFVNWSGSGGFVTTVLNPMTVANVTAAQSITANFAPDPVNGVCGSSNGGIFKLAPTTNLCSAGVSSVVNGNGTWGWTCAGANSGTSASCTATIDEAGPTLVISTLANGSITNNATMNISGTVSDISGIATLTINGTAVAVTSGAFSTAITLAAAANIITISTTDTLGNSTTETRSITLDQSAPTLTVSAPADNGKTAQPLATVSGTISETSTVTVKLNSGTAQSAAITGSSYSADVTLAAGLNTISIVATDLAGNTSSAVRSVIYDNSNPTLSVTNPAQDVNTVLSKLIISGTVSDAVTSATINITADGQSYAPVVAADGSFNQTINLPTDKTYAVVVTATDQAGNSSTSQRNIIKTTVSAATGDINGDGKVDIADALKALRITIGLESATPALLLLADVAPLAGGKPAPDGVIDIADAVVILEKAVGLVSW